MTTEHQDQQTEQTQNTQESTVQLSPIEISAKEQGWVPKEEWEKAGKDPSTWRSAKEYVERGELFAEINALKDSNKKTSAAFKALVEHHRKVYDSAVKEAIRKLKQEKLEALKNLDTERVLEIDEELERVKTDQPPLPDVEVETTVEPSATFRSWHRKNSWYKLDGDDDASLFANTVGMKWRQNNPNGSEKEFLEHVEKEVFKRFPEVFDNPNRHKVSDVNPKGDDKQNKKVYKLTPEEERACDMFVAQGVFKNREEYIKELRKISEEE